MSKLSQLDFTEQFFFLYINEISTAMYTDINKAATIHTVHRVVTSFCDAVGFFVILCVCICVCKLKGKSLMD